MFGLNAKSDNSDKLVVQVHAAAEAEAFAMAKKLWDENSRIVHADQATGKEYLRFLYAQLKCVVWLQRDIGRTDIFELIVRWETGMHEVYVVGPGPQPTGDITRPKALLTSMLTTPSVVSSVSQ
jgi:hypothetical protein